MRKILINFLILGVVAAFVWFVVWSVNRQDRLDKETVAEHFVSPYSELVHIPIDGLVGFDLTSDAEIVVATQDSVIYNEGGFAIDSGLRDMRIASAEIYLLYPTRIEVYSFSGDKLRQWQACSDNSDYAAIEVSGESVYTSDAANKNVCRYDTVGNFRGFIKSPTGFVIPSYSFDMAVNGDVLYVVNSGKHSIESYTLQGEYIGTQGSSEDYVGCCNPSYISFDDRGELYTSEKGVPRIKNSKATLMMSKGKEAQQIRVVGDRLYTAKSDGVTIYKLGDASECDDCQVVCPLRK